MDLKKRVQELCKLKGVTAQQAELDLGFGKGYISKLNASVPNAAKIQSMAEYFNVTFDYLMNDEKNAPALTAKDKRDIAKDLQTFIDDMESGNLMFDGDPMSPEAKESIIAAMKLGLEAAKAKNKERFTPKKYKNKKD